MRAVGRGWAIFGIAVPTMAVVMNFSIVSIAMTTLQKQFHASIVELQWLLNAFGIVIASLMVTMGKLADAHGRRFLYLIGTFLICLASLVAGFAPDLRWIIVSQAVQGVAGAIIIPISQALLSHLYPEHRRSHAIGIWATVMSIALGIGPIVGGAVLEKLGWRWIFFMNVPTAIFAFFLLLRCVPESKSAYTRAKIDVRGVMLLILTIGSLVISIMQAPYWGFKVLWSMAFFVLALALFIFSERKSKFPIIAPQFFFRRTFLFSTLANFCIIFFVWGSFFLLPYYFQKEQGFSPLQTGLIMLLATSPVSVFSSWVGKAYHRVGPKWLMVLGFLFLAISGIAQLFLRPDHLSFSLMAALFFGIGMVLAWGPSITSAISSVPRDAAAAASGAFTTVQEIGGTLGLTIVGTAFGFGNHFTYGASVLLISAILGLLFSMGLRGQRAVDR